MQRKTRANGIRLTRRQQSPTRIFPPLYIPKRGNFCICQKSDLFAEISHPQNTSVSFHIYIKVLTLSSLQDSLKTAFLYSSDLVTQKYSLNMYKWRIIISGSIVLIISYSSRTAIFHWRTIRSSDKCVRRWQSEASKLTSLTDRLSSSAFLPRMVKLSFVLSRFYCDLLNPNRSRIKKKKKRKTEPRELPRWVMPKQEPWRERAKNNLITNLRNI